MDNPSGKIRKFVAHADGRHAVIDVDVAVACPRCAQGKGCGAGLLSGSGAVRQIEAIIEPDLKLVEGDTVEIALKPRSLLHAAMVVYGAPMLGAITSAGIAYGLTLGDSQAAAAALAGMSVGMLAGRWYLSRPSCLSRFVPTIEKRLPDAQGV